MIYVQERHLTVAWFSYWIMAPQLTGNASALSVCDDTRMPLFGLSRGETVRVFMYVKAGLCEHGGDRARGRGLTLWEPRLVE